MKRAAQPFVPRADVRHAPICNYYSRLVFGEEIKGFAAVLGKQYGVPLARERLLDQFAIDRGIINRENLERLGSRVHVVG